MQELNILQIGDLHYPGHAGVPDADVKDHGFSGATLGLATVTKMGAALRQPARQRNARKSTVLICGDLTDGGKSPGYVSATTQLRQVFELDDKVKSPPDSWHVAIGNHDIDRSVVTPKNPASSAGKYQFATEAWAPHNVLPVDAQRITEYSENGCALQLISIDSCVGSAEHRAVPEGSGAAPSTPDINDSDLAGSSDTESSSPNENYEQMDAPAFQETHLDAVMEAIRSSPFSSVPVVLSHHNLLPQATPRIAIYTELVNGGAARNRFANANRTVLYLHGHIHADAVEIIEQPGSGRIVSVSAPQLIDGFNFIVVAFGSMGQPLGITIEPWKVGHGGDVSLRHGSQIRIRLAKHNTVVDEFVRALVRELRVSDKEVFRFADVCEIVRRSHKGKTAAKIGAALREAEWLDALSITDRDSEPQFWTIKLEGI